VIGAVVGVQPFGGMGLSGTGPKAGGPLYLYRLLQAPTDTHSNNSNPALNSLAESPTCHASVGIETRLAKHTCLAALQALTDALKAPGLAQLDAWQGNGNTVTQAVLVCQTYNTSSVLGQRYDLPGPTGETNRYQLLPRGTVWGTPLTPLGLVHQVAATLASGNRYWLKAPLTNSSVARLLAALPDPVQAFVRICQPEEMRSDLTWGALLFEGDADELQVLSNHIAQRPGALIRIDNLSSAQLAAGASYDLSALMHEQSISTNTAAAGGNAQLMTMD
jgi:RHH-type proline utilization regulon transcriptional repressor/proline dehydrogenase/delta 1-pyrroline-5-carboxylate dehydrogenase